jgi:rod shape determining protein RodA
MSTINPSTYLKKIDGVLILLYLLLVTIGFVSIYAVEHTSESGGFFQMDRSYMRQLIFLAIGLVISVIILFTDSKTFPNLAYLAYGLGILLLLATLVLGRNVNGSRSFLVVGPIQIQPAEMVKFFTALALAKFLSAIDTNYLDNKNRYVAMAIALFPALIILLQKETGVALVYFSFFLAMYREGLPNWIPLLGFGLIFLTVATLMLSPLTFSILIIIIVLLSLYSNRKKIKRKKSILFNTIGIALIAIAFSQFLVPITFTKILKPYQVERIYTMIGQEVPEMYSQGKPVGRESAADYNVRQSKIAIASGGFFGKGFLNGEQTKNDWVPEQRTDFIFCSVAEQFGFLGSTILVILYMCLILRISYIAERQRSKFSRVFAYSLAGILFFHILINLGMTIGIAPVIGIPLPLVSYGGTSLLTFTIMIFVLIRLDADRSMILR